MKKIFIFSLIFLIVFGCKEKSIEKIKLEEDKWLNKEFQIFSISIKDLKKNGQIIYEGKKTINSKILPLLEKLIIGIRDNKPELIISMYNNYDIKGAKKQYYWNSQRHNFVEDLSLEQFKEKWAMDLRTGNDQSPYLGLRYLFSLREDILKNNIGWGISGVALSEGESAIVMIDIYKKEGFVEGDVQPRIYYYANKEMDIDFSLWTEPIDVMLGEPVK